MGGIYGHLHLTQEESPINFKPMTEKQRKAKEWLKNKRRIEEKENKKPWYMREMVILQMWLILGFLVNSLFNAADRGCFPVELRTFFAVAFAIMAIPIMMRASYINKQNKKLK